MELSYCVTNTNGRDYLLTCLDAISETHPEGVEHEILVLDNASDDDSVDLVKSNRPDVRLIARDRRGGLAENNSILLREGKGDFCLLLNEDAQLLPGATKALLDALRDDPKAAIAGSQLIYPDGRGIGCAWRLPGLGTAIADALFLNRWLVVQVSQRTREVGSVQSASMLVRHSAAEAVGYYDEDFFLYFEEIDFQARLHDAGWRILHVPESRTIHHQQFSIHSSPGSDRRVVEFQRMRDLYMRKHHSRAVVQLTRLLTAWKYLLHTIAAIPAPRRKPSWYWLHVRRALRPDRGEGMRERADAYNARAAAAARSSSPTTPPSNSVAR